MLRARCAGLQVWVHFFSLCAATSATTDSGSLMERAIDASHGELLGWWTQQTVSIACKATGQWSEMALLLGPSQAETQADAKLWCAQVTEIVQALKAVQREYDFEDKRRSA